MTFIELCIAATITFLVFYQPVIAVQALLFMGAVAGAALTVTALSFIYQEIKHAWIERNRSVQS